MKKLVVLMLVAMGFLANAAFADLKVAVIDLREVFEKTSKMEAINKSLTDEFKPREEAIKTLQEKLQKNHQKLEKDAAVMSEKDLKKLEDEIKNDRIELQRLSITFQEDAAVAQNKAMQNLINEIQKIIDNVAADKGYDLVLQSEGVPYYKDSLDITEEVIKKLK